VDGELRIADIAEIAGIAEIGKTKISPWRNGSARRSEIVAWENQAI
jgi:hypothetical protein